MAEQHPFLEKTSPSAQYAVALRCARIGLYLSFSKSFKNGGVWILSFFHVGTVLFYVISGPMSYSHILVVIIFIAAFFVWRSNMVVILVMVEVAIVAVVVVVEVIIALHVLLFFVCNSPNIFFSLLRRTFFVSIMLLLSLAR